MAARRRRRAVRRVRRRRQRGRGLFSSGKKLFKKGVALGDRALTSKIGGKALDYLARRRERKLAQSGNGFFGGLAKSLIKDVVSEIV